MAALSATRGNDVPAAISVSEANLDPSHRSRNFACKGHVDLKNVGPIGCPWGMLGVWIVVIRYINHLSISCRTLKSACTDKAPSVLSKSRVSPKCRDLSHNFHFEGQLYVSDARQICLYHDHGSPYEWDPSSSFHHC